MIGKTSETSRPGLQSSGQLSISLSSTIKNSMLEGVGARGYTFGYEGSVIKILLFVLRFWIKESSKIRRSFTVDILLFLASARDLTLHCNY